MFLISDIRVWFSFVSVSSCCIFNWISSKSRLGHVFVLLYSSVLGFQLLIAQCGLGLVFKAKILGSLVLVSFFTINWVWRYFGPSTKILTLKFLALSLEDNSYIPIIFFGHNKRKFLSATLTLHLEWTLH